MADETDYTPYSQPATQSSGDAPTASAAFPEPADEDKAKAREQGVLDAIKESTKEAYKSGANEGYGDNGEGPRFNGTMEVAHLEHLVDLPIDKLNDVLNGKGVNPGDNPVPLSENQIAGLLEVERSGKNRTDRVRVLCKRLGIKSPYEATNAGPAYTVDTTNLNDL